MQEWFDGELRRAFGAEANTLGWFDPTLGPPDLTATLSVTLGAATLSATGQVEIRGVLSKTLAAATLTATGTVTDTAPVTSPRLIIPMRRR